MQQKFSRVTSTPAYKLVADAIEREIIAGRIRPGDPLGTEAELVKQFGVNRSTVREGIRQLEQGGLVRRDSSRRLWVGLPHYDQLATRMSRALVLQEVTFRELYEAAMPVQIATIEWAVERATPEIIAELDENIAHTEEALDDPAAVAELDAEFHGLIGDALRLDLAEKKVRVSTVYPGATDTQIFDKVPGEWDRSKMNKPEDVAEVVWKAYNAPAGTNIDDLDVPPPK
jgi:DNA-binding FadR family transcriptional regulator